MEFLEEIDKELSSKITLVAAGGTAMTLLDVKPSTIDMDFTGPADSTRELNAVLEILQPGFRFDCWPDGMVFSQTLPDDYLRKGIPIETALKHIELRALHTRYQRVSHWKARSTNCFASFSMQTP